MTKIVYMGTPEFAVPVLEKLNEHYNVVACVTRADKPKGRSGKPAKSPVREAAEALGIPVLTPEKVRTPEFYEELRAFDADFFVTCAYGKILPQEVLDIPRMGVVNVHASLLPKYRGAAPIWRVIINGESETGITTMLTDAGMDTGDILLTERVEITENMTTGELHDLLAPVGAELIVKTLDGLLEGSVTRTKQNSGEATYAPMVEREDGAVDWTKSASEIHNRIRGCNPFPGAYTFIDGSKLKIWVSEVCRGVFTSCAPGTIINADKSGILAACGDGGVVNIKEIQAENQKRMTVGAFLNGHAIAGRFESAEAVKN